MLLEKPTLNMGKKLVNETIGSSIWNHPIFVAVFGVYFLSRMGMFHCYVSVPQGNISPKNCLEDHPRTCKWLGSPRFISHKKAIWKGNSVAPENRLGPKRKGGSSSNNIHFPFVNSLVPDKIFQV